MEKLTRRRYTLEYTFNYPQLGACMSEVGPKECHY
jgi:hypothetical protein